MLLASYIARLQALSTRWARKCAGFEWVDSRAFGTLVKSGLHLIFMYNGDKDATFHVLDPLHKSATSLHAPYF